VADHAGNNQDEGARPECYAAESFVSPQSENRGPPLPTIKRNELIIAQVLLVCSVATIVYLEHKDIVCFSTEAGPHPLAIFVFKSNQLSPPRVGSRFGAETHTALIGMVLVRLSCLSRRVTSSPVMSGLRIRAWARLPGSRSCS
jgi:hypothetical protein